MGGGAVKNGKWVNKMRCDWLRRELISGLELWRHSCRVEEPQGGLRDCGRKYTERDERKPRSGLREVRMRILADGNLKLVIGESKGWGGLSNNKHACIHRDGFCFHSNDHKKEWSKAELSSDRAQPLPTSSPGSVSSYRIQPQPRLSTSHLCMHHRIH